MAHKRLPPPHTSKLHWITKSVVVVINGMCSKVCYVIILSRAQLRPNDFKYLSSACTTRKRYIVVLFFRGVCGSLNSTRVEYGLGRLGLSAVRPGALSKSGYVDALIAFKFA